MKSERMLKQVSGVFVAALVLYVLVYHWIEQRRTAKGPWQVTFTNSSGVPAIVVQQPALGISNVQLRFSGETSTNPPETQTFASPRPVPFPVPFGRCVFEDTTFLPGTVTFQLFGHEVELLPRVLIIDHQEHRWIPNSTNTLAHLTNAAAQSINRID